MDLRDITARVNATLDAMTPDELWVVFMNAASRVVSHVYPEAIIMADLDQTDPDRVTDVTVACPRPGCTTVNDAALIDGSPRENTFGQYRDYDNSDGYLGLPVHEGETDFQTIAHKCRGCGMPFNLPEFAEVTWP